jgi:transposase
MGFNFREYNQDQGFLLPCDIRDWVKPDSLAGFVNDTVELFGQRGMLRAFFACYREDGWGNKAFHPVMMLKVLLYAYCKGVTSSRRIAELLECDIHFRFLSANQTPDFRTVNLFRIRHTEAFSQLFVDVLRLARESGLAKMGTVALDGHKVAGNAALDQNRSLEQLRKQVDDLMAQAHQSDLSEDTLFGEARGDELPAQLRNRQERLERLQAAQERLEELERQAKTAQEKKIAQRQEEEATTGKKKRGRKPKTPEQAQADLQQKAPKANVTDPDSRILKGRHGFIQGYNGQAVVDCDSQIIVAQDLTQQENDQGQLEPMLKACVQQAGQAPERLLADAGYNSEANAGLEDQEPFTQTELYICQQKEYKERREAARLQEQEGEQTPTGHEEDSPEEVPNTPCETNAAQRVRERMQSPEGKVLYKKRAATVEPVFGQMLTRGLTRINLRGFQKARTEWSLWCTTHNMLKLWRANCARKPLIAAVT